MPAKVEPKLVEEHVPIKKYYGRKRDDQSSSEESDAYDGNNIVPTDTTKYDANHFENPEKKQNLNFSFCRLICSADVTSSSTTSKSTNLGKAASLHTKVSKNNTICLFLSTPNQNKTKKTINCQDSHIGFAQILFYFL